jgi:hypothetical protein
MTDGPSFKFAKSGISPNCVTAISFRALFSMKSNWALGCTTRDRCPGGRNTVKHTRDCGVGQMA